MAHDQEVDRPLSDEEVFGPEEREAPPERHVMPIERIMGDVAENIRRDSAQEVKAISDRAMKSAETMTEKIEASLASERAATKEAIVAAVRAIKMPDAPDLSLVGDKIAKAVSDAVEASQRDFSAKVIASNERVLDALKSLSALLATPKEDDGETMCDIMRDDSGDMKRIVFRKPDKVVDDGSPKNAMEAAKRVISGGSK